MRKQNMLDLPTERNFSHDNVQLIENYGDLGEQVWRCMYTCLISKANLLSAET